MAKWQKVQNPKVKKVQYRTTTEEAHYLDLAVKRSGLDRARFCEIAVSRFVATMLALPGKRTAP